METHPLDIDAARSEAARSHARRVLAAEDVQHPALETLVAVHTAATRAGWPERYALEAAAGIARNGDSPLSTDAETLASVLVLSRAHDPGAVIAGVHERLQTYEPAPPGLRFEGRSYRRRAVQRPLLVGVDEQRGVIEHEVGQLFAYVPEVGRNARAGVRHPALLLYGPPGTGKSSLCRHAFYHARELSRHCGVPFRHEIFGAADYSKWVGESAKNLAGKLSLLADPAGVGILVIDDADMLLSARQHEVTSAGLHHVTAELMQWLSGVEERSENVLFIATTNRPEDIDPALDSRLGRRLEVPAYSMREQFASYVEARLPEATPAARSLLVERFYRDRLAPRAMDHACRALLARAYGPVSVGVLALAPAERFEALLRPARELDESLVSAYLAGTGARPS